MYVYVLHVYIQTDTKYNKSNVQNCKKEAVNTVQKYFIIRNQNNNPFINQKFSVYHLSISEHFIHNLNKNENMECTFFSLLLRPILLSNYNLL